MTDISVVVVSCGNLSLTISCLSSLIEYTFNSAQILLIDNGSPETIKTFLEKFCQERGIDFISLHKNFGPGFARRIGLQHTKHEIVSFVDDDIVVTPNWDLFLVEKLLCDSNVGQVSSIMSGSDLIHPFLRDIALSVVWSSASSQLNVPDAIDEFVCSCSHMDFMLALRDVNSLADYELVHSPPDAIGGGCFFTRKSKLHCIGGIADVNFDTYGNEDIDLSWRIGQSGSTIFRCNLSYVHHFKHGGSEYLFSREERKELLSYSNDYFIDKWRDVIFRLISGKNIEDVNSIKENWFLSIIFEKARNQGK